MSSPADGPPLAGPEQFQTQSLRIPADELGRIGPYRLVRLVGRGSMGKVYQAEDADGQPVALKVITETPALSELDLRRFMREAEAVKQLGRHPGIVSVYAHGSLGRNHYIAMALVPEGLTLQHRLQQGRLTVPEALKLSQIIVSALAHAHRQGVIHRDLKPANILMTPEGLPLLSDFGLARAADSARLTVTGEIFGTPRYMSPEQARHGQRELTAQSDIYSFGVILYEALTGSSPYDLKPGLSFNEMLQLVWEAKIRPPSELNAEIPPKLEAIMLKLLRRDLEQRYRTMGEVQEALDRCLAGDHGASIGDWLWDHRRGVLIAAGAGLLTLGAAVLVLWLRRH